MSASEKPQLDRACASCYSSFHGELQCPNCGGTEAYIRCLQCGCVLDEDEAAHHDSQVCYVALGENCDLPF